MTETVLRKYIRDLSTMVYFSFDETGKIHDLNKFAWDFIGGSHLKTVKDVFVDFNETLDVKDLFNLRKPLSLTVNQKDRNPFSMMFNFIQEKNICHAFGEGDIHTCHQLQKELVDINSEYSVLTRELFKKNVELEKLGKLKTQFIGVAAHDLRNPIGNILTTASLLEMEISEKLDEGQKKLLKAIMDLGEFGLRLLDDLLQISHIESGKYSLEVSVINLSQIIRENIDINRLFANNKEKEIIFHQPDAIANARADKHALNQILNNLISNAIKYSPRGIPVEIGIIPSDDFQTVYVKDYGEGIPLEEQDKIFLPFETGSVKATENEKSTGLGLWIVNMLVHKLSGKIWLKSSPGEGTVFYFSLPV